MAISSKEKTMPVDQKKLSKAARLKEFKNQTVLQFLSKYNKQDALTFDIKGKMKLTSSDVFADTVNNLVYENIGEAYPIIMGQVSGFYETATLAGLMALECKDRTKPFVLFFDRNSNNIMNALFNSFLISLSDSKEEFLKTILSLDDIDIIKAFNSKLYNKLVKSALTENKELLNSDTKIIDDYIMTNYIKQEDLNNTLDQMYSLPKLKEYVLNKKYTSSQNYDSNAHLKKLVDKAKAGLNKEMASVFENISTNMCNYFATSNNFIDFANYLFNDIDRNKDVHILDNDDAFKGYKTLLSKNGKGNVKFLPNIDITKSEGIEELEKVLRNENFIYDGLDKNKFPVDIAIIPHIRRLQASYPFLKQTAQFFVEANRSTTKKGASGKWNYQHTSTLYNINHDNIGANFIDEELNNKPKLNNLNTMEKLDGYPVIVSMAGINYGNIYTSYADLENIVAMAKADKADTVFVQGLVYANYKRYQTKRRNLSDPKYPDLDSRLKAARSFVDDLNKSGIKVVYQTGDEDDNLKEELFYTYFFDELKQQKNFLARKDVDPVHDWIKDILSADLVPYLIRSGKDITTYYDEKGVKQTRIGEVCSYIRAIKDGTPLGKLDNLVDEHGEKLIDEKYLHNTEMFEIITDKLVKFDKNSSRISVDMIHNPNFSSRTQYGNPDYGLLKRIGNYQSGAIKSLERPQIILDSRQPYMGFNIIGGREAQVAMNTPQLTDDSRYYMKDFLTSSKYVLEDPTHKRVTQLQNKLNFPGSWTITGDLDWVMRVCPYWRRSREVMEYVQKTGEPLPKMVELHINDIQLGSITERLSDFAKLLDIGFYKYGADIVTYLGDLQQGSNYPRFPIESRHTAAQSVGQQTVDFLKIQRPWIKNAFGIVNPKIFETNENNLSINEEVSRLIVEYLFKKQLIEKRCGEYGDVYSIKGDVDYKNINLQLPESLKPYEKHIRARLNTVRLIKMIKIAEGNHEKNTDWNHKGYKPLEALKSELEVFKSFSNADVDIKYAEFILNSEGDYVEGSYCYSETNGYATLSAHNMRTPSKGSGGSATRNMANYIQSLGVEYQNVDIVEQGHLHNFEASVINEKLYLVIPGLAGQSGFEQMLGYSSHPRGVVKTYWPDGRLTLDIISSNFLGKWEIMNPEIKKIGLDNYIRDCLMQDVPIISSQIPDQIHQPYQRELRPLTLTKKLGPSIPRNDK